jgi:hypothetical protein
VSEFTPSFEEIPPSPDQTQQIDSPVTGDENVPLSEPPQPQPVQPSPAEAGTASAPRVRPEPPSQDGAAPSGSHAPGTYRRTGWRTTDPAVVCETYMPNATRCPDCGFPHFVNVLG